MKTKRVTVPVVVNYGGFPCLAEEFEAQSWEPSESWMPPNLWQTLLSQGQIDYPLSRACSAQGVVKLHVGTPFRIVCCDRMDLHVYPLTRQNSQTIHVAIGQCPVCRRIHWASDSMAMIAVRVPFKTVLVNGPPRRME